MNTQDKAAIAAASAHGGQARNDIRIVTLDEPIQRGDTIITDVTVNRPFGPALRGLSLAKIINEADYDSLEKLIPRITNPLISAADMQNGTLAPSDLLQITGEITDFFIPKKVRSTQSPTE